MEKGGTSQRVGTALIAALLATIIVLQWITFAEQKDQRAQLAAIEEAAKRAGDETDLLMTMREEILTNMMAEKVEQLTGDLDTPQERCIAIGKWLKGNLRNLSQFREANDGLDHDGRYAMRMGTCGHRSNMMVRMLDLAGVHARIWNMYNFGGRAGGGHAVIQAWYDDDWHFFDPFYGGYFIKDGDVLSWDEIHALGEDAPQYMVFWPTRLDRMRRGSSDPDDPAAWARVRPNRMASAYRPEQIVATRSVGFLRDPSMVKTLYPQIDAATLAQKPITIGKLDGESEDVRVGGVKQGLSERMDRVGNLHDYFRFTYEFHSATPGKQYRITLHVKEYRDCGPDDFTASAEGASLVSGEKPDDDVWQVTVTAEEADFQITFDRDLDELGQAMQVDQIIIESLD